MDVEDEDTSAGGGTQVEDSPPGTLGEDHLEGTAMESEDEVMETPLSGSDQEGEVVGMCVVPRKVCVGRGGGGWGAIYGFKVAIRHALLY